MNKLHTDVLRLRRLGYAEAASWALLLLGMILKYGFDKPAMVTYTGWVHGLLFILYCVHLVLVQQVLKWSFSKLVIGGIAAFVPFGTLWFDKRIENPGQNLI